MQVTILEAVPTSGGRWAVRFCSEYGIGHGLWMDGQPETGKTYYVEVNIPGIIRWGADLVISNERVARLWEAGDSVYLTVLLETIDDVWGYHLRLGDTFIWVETVGAPFPVGSYVQIHTEQLHLYDEHI